MCRLCTRDGQTSRHVGRGRKPKPVFAPDESSTDTERAWAAGFFDGEGWTSTMYARTSRHGRRRYVQVGVGQAEHSTLDRFAAAVGGGSITEGIRNEKPFWQWRVSGRGAYDVLARLWPFLSAPKREQFLRVEAEAD